MSVPPRKAAESIKTGRISRVALFKSRRAKKCRYPNGYLHFLVREAGLEFSMAFVFYSKS